MFWRFNLTDPGNNVFQPSDPSGWEEAAINLERHPEFHSLVETFTSSLLTYGSNGSVDGGRDWLLGVESTYGPDATIQILVEIDNAENGNWETVFQGQIGVALFIESLDTDHFLQYVVAPQDFWSKFIARYSTQVDIRANQSVTEKALNQAGTITPTPYFNLPLPSQKVIKEFRGYLRNNQIIDMADYVNGGALTYAFLDVETKILDEITNKYTYGLNSSRDIPFALFTVTDAGDFDLDLSFDISIGDNGIGTGGGAQTPGYQNRNLKPTEKTTFAVVIQVNDGPLIYAGTTNFNLPASYKRNDGTTIQYADYYTDPITFLQHYAGWTRFSYKTLGYGGTNPSLKLNKNDSVRVYIKTYPSNAIGLGLNSTPAHTLFPIFFYGREGWSNDNFPWLFSGYEDNGYSRYSGLVSAALDASLPHSANPLVDSTTGYPLYTTDGVTSPRAGDTYIVGVAGNINGTAVDAGWILQAKVSNPGNTAANWWLSPISLYAGTENFGNSYLNAKFNTTDADSVSGLYSALGTNSYTITSSLISAYAVGLNIFVQFQNANTGASTLNINGLGAVPIKKLDGSALVANDIVSILVASGTNTYAVSYGFLSLSEGVTLTVKFTNANTGASTLNVNGLGAVAIQYKGNAIGSGAITAGQTVQLIYDGTYWQIQDGSQQVTGQVYVLNYDGAEFIITPISSTNQITPTANKTAQSFLAHDVMSGILDRITDNTNLFYSNFLGNQWTVRQYVSSGCGSLLAVMKGLHLRGFTLPEKSFFSSAQDWWDGINPIMNLGLGYDKINGQNVIRVEQKSYFYDPTMSVLFSNVQKISRTYDTDYQFNQVEIGYNKWQSQAASGVGAPSGIDDPQSSRKYTTLFKIIGKPIKIVSQWIAASLTIETTKRVGVLKNANYTYDDDTFVIAVKANGDGTFTPELNENFSTINNLNNPETRYNTRLTPARNLLRWIDYLSGCLNNYLSSFFTFASGTGNYNTQTTATSSCPGDDTGVLVSENGNFSPSNTPYFIPQLFEIEHYLDWEDYQTIRNNRNQAIGISQTSSGHVPFFIKNMSYNIAKGTVKISAWPKYPFQIQVIDSPASEEILQTSYFYERPGYDPAYE